MTPAFAPPTTVRPAARPCLTSADPPRTHPALDDTAS